MSWREAFFAQALSEYAVRQQLNNAKVEYSHQLHYVQMVTEKLAKAYAVSMARDAPPVVSHAAFVRLLQTTKSRPEIRHQLGYEDAASFRQFIDSLLPLAERIERLAPNFAGTTNPNPEYPWEDRATGQVIAPVQFEFPEFDAKSPQMVKLERLLGALIRLGI
jgi:hypothetical protein